MKLALLFLVLSILDKSRTTTPTTRADKRIQAICDNLPTDGHVKQSDEDIEWARICRNLADSKLADRESAVEQKYAASKHRASHSR
jgi:hypothetical protein